MKMSIKKVLGLKKDLEEMYEFNKHYKTSGLFSEERLKTMKQIRGAVGEIDRQLETIEVEFDLGKMHLSSFEFNVNSDGLSNE